MSRGVNAGFWLDNTAAYTFVGETTILPLTVIYQYVDGFGFKVLLLSHDNVSLRENDSFPRYFKSFNEIQETGQKYLVGKAKQFNRNRIQMLESDDHLKK
jgi:hypothetical protein